MFSENLDHPLVHGGGLVAAQRLFTDAPQPFIDLSTGINPYSYPLPQLPPDLFTRLPDPEAAMAGALDLSLAGPRVYGGVRVEDAFMGGGRREADVKDIDRALALYRTADAILVALVALLAAIFIVPG